MEREILKVNTVQCFIVKGKLFFFQKKILATIASKILITDSDGMVWTCQYWRHGRQLHTSNTARNYGCSNGSSGSICRSISTGCSSIISSFSSSSILMKVVVIVIIE